MSDRTIIETSTRLGVTVDYIKVALEQQAHWQGEMTRLLMIMAESLDHIATRIGSIGDAYVKGEKMSEAHAISEGWMPQQPESVNSVKGIPDLRRVDEAIKENMAKPHDHPPVVIGNPEPREDGHDFKVGDHVEVRGQMGDALEVTAIEGAFAQMQNGDWYQVHDLRRVPHQLSLWDEEGD